MGSAWGGTSGLDELETGQKVQEIREAPAALLLLDASRRLEHACISSDVLRMKLGVEQIWVREAAEGRWFRSVREGAQAFISSVSSRVAGTVTYRLAPYRMDPVSVVGEDGLYVRDRTLIEPARSTQPSFRRGLPELPA